MSSSSTIKKRRTRNVVRKGTSSCSYEKEQRRDDDFPEDRYQRKNDCRQDHDDDNNTVGYKANKTRRRTERSSSPPTNDKKRREQQQPSTSTSTTRNGMLGINNHLFIPIVLSSCMLILIAISSSKNDNITDHEFHSKNNTILYVVNIPKQYGQLGLNSNPTNNPSPDYGGLRDNDNSILPSWNQRTELKRQRNARTSHLDDDSHDEDDEEYCGDEQHNPISEPTTRVDSHKVGGCRKVQWHRLTRPNCNTFHELSLSESKMKYLG
jgi:hypothetical protein